MVTHSRKQGRIQDVNQGGRGVQNIIFAHAYREARREPPYGLCPGSRALEAVGISPPPPPRSLVVSQPYFFFFRILIQNGINQNKVDQIIGGGGALVPPLNPPHVKARPVRAT